ncbi:protein of unknown function [Burkholderia multivorans]
MDVEVDVEPPEDVVVDGLVRLHIALALAAGWLPPLSPPQADRITGTIRERTNGAILRIGLFLVRFGLRRTHNRGSLDAKPWQGRTRVQSRVPPASGAAVEGMKKRRTMDCPLHGRDRTPGGFEHRQLSTAATERSACAGIRERSMLLLIRPIDN